MVTVRKARLTDVNALSELALRLIKSHTAYDGLFYKVSPTLKKEYLKYFNRAVRSKNWLLVLAEEGNEIAGYALAAIEKRPPVYSLQKRCMLHDLFVETRFRGKGVSRQLFKMVLAFAKSKKIKMLQVTVDERNNGAINVYGKFGFEYYDKTMAMKL
tara:strand:+ start:2660 stop:3130 length:471 start_codon:yes stop_codon:yes gene_type:complete